MKPWRRACKETGKTRPPKKEMNYYEAATRWRRDGPPRPSSWTWLLGYEQGPRATPDPWHPQHLDHSGDGKGCKLDIPSADNQYTHAAQNIDDFDLRETQCHMAGSSTDAPRWVPQQVRTSSTRSPSIAHAINDEHNGDERRANYRPDSWMA